MKQTEFFVIVGHFLPSYTPNSPENQIFEKMKKSSSEIIFLHMCTNNDNHNVWFRRYWVWQTYFLSFWNILPFNPPNNPEKQNIEKMKETHGDIMILHMCAINEKNS